ncbi:MAG: hypothetical protein FWG03_10580, partial [Clostridiales bacterium]|nr:hypothetical protein [Clostridiales bacterium]
GGVYVSSGGFVMKGGKICGNESVCIEVFGKDIDEMRRNFSYLESEYTEAALRMMLSSGMLDIIRGKGGGVFVDFGTFTMGGGEISGNEARYKSSSLMNDSTGGGVYTGEGGKFEMGGSARILHNKAGEGSGVCNSGAFNMGGSAEIVGNNSDSGSAVVNLGTFTMDGETKISENSGSGVDNRGTFNMGGSAVIKNNIKNGVSNENIFIMGGSAVVKDNRKRGVFSSKTFEMGGSASIEGNNDGGVHNNGDFNMGGEAVISDNINHDDGGGVFNRGTFTMGGSAEISKNHAAAGGGVYNDGSFSMDGYAIIKDNHASLPRRTHENDGGGGVFNKGAFTMGGLALISGNSAQNGSGIFWEGGGINLSGSAMVGTHTRDNEITRGAGQAINIAAEGLKGAYYNISPPPSSAGVKFDVKGTVIAKKAEGSVTNAEAGYFYYAGSSFRCIEKDGDVILLPRHERGWILILVLATGTALLLLVLTLSGRLRIGKRVLTVIIVGVVATGMVFSILFDQNQRGDDYHALAREQYKWDMHYLRADTESPPTAGSDGTVDYKSTATYLIAICFVNDFPEFGIDPGQFVRIVINGLPSNYGPDWMPIEDVMENRQRVAYFCFAGEKGAYLGWGAKKGIDSARAFAGSAGSKGPCLYKTFAANKAYFDQLMYRDFPESCVGGVIPLDTEIIDWPLPMAKILVDMYDAENADDAEDTDDADGAEDTEDANSAGDADDAEYAGDEETQAADIE